MTSATSQELSLPTEEARALRYMPQLDALRTIAVLGVFIGHFAVDAAKPYGWHRGLDWGQWGVQLFFVLSGYLITRILLQCRDRIDTGKLGLGAGLLKFYGRRFLRLLPIYYITLAVMAVLAIVWQLEPEWIKDAWWYITYMQNWLFVIVGNRDTPNHALNHFWTLAIEEQFYLLWAPIVLLLPRRWLAPVIVLLILSVFPFKLVLSVQPIDWPWVDVRLCTPAQFDTLGLGSLLAVMHEYWEDGYRKAERITRVLLFIGLVLMVPFVIARHLNFRTMEAIMDPPVKNGLLFLFGSTASGMIFVWVIHKASRGFEGLAGRALEFAPLVYLGKISYGLYVYHMPVKAIVLTLIVPGLGLTMPGHPLVHFVILTTCTIAVSMVSWHLIEKPLQRLKRYMRYDT